MAANLNYDPNDPLPDHRNPGDKEMELYLDAEYPSMPASGYEGHEESQVWRERASIIVFNVSMRENFEPVVPYLSMNYFDRYVSGNNAPLPKMMGNRQNDLELLCICCLTLACKMRDKSFSIIRFKERHFDLKAVETEKFLAMELNILNGIKWHLRPVTPLCFVRFLAPEINSIYGIRRRTVNQIIVNAQSEILNTQYRPSVMAASALLAAAWFLYPRQFQSSLDQMASKKIFKKDELLKCTKRLIRMSKESKLLIESTVAEYEYFPRRSVRAEDEVGSSHDMGGPSASSSSVAESSFSELRTPRVTWAHRPGKEKMDEEDEEDEEEDDRVAAAAAAAARSVKMVEDVDGVEMGFMLRWKLGEKNRDGFVIFMDAPNPQPRPTAADAAAAAEAATEAAVAAGAAAGGCDPVHEFCDFCCFCCCPSCNPF